MTPGLYLRDVREAAGMSIDDVAFWIGTVPPVSARRRAQLIADTEAGLVPVSLSTAVALASIPMMGVDLIRLAELVDAEQRHPRMTSQVPLLVLAGNPR